MLPGDLGNWRLVCFTQDRDHLLFGKTTLLHGLLAGLREPFSQVTFGPKNRGRSIEAGTEGTTEASTIIVRGFEGKRKPPVAIAYVRLDGIDSAIGNYIDGLDLTDYEAAMKKITSGRRVRVQFTTERTGRITDFSFYCVD